MAQQFKVNTLVLSRQVVTATGNNIYVNGLLVGSGIYSTIDALAQTGSILYQDIIGLSGSINVSGASYLSLLQSTGQTLYNYIIGLSGTMNSLVAATGQAAWISANGAASSISGNMATTGAALIARDLAISGVLQGYITSADSDVNSINGQSGTLTIAGTGGLTVLSGAQGLILVSGDQSISGALTATGVALGTIIAQTGQASYGLYTGLSGALQSTGSNLQTQINTLTTNLTQTGVIIEGQLNSLSGWAASAANLQLTGSNLYNQLIGYSGYAGLTFATLTNLALTGSNLYNALTGLSGQSNVNYATVTNLFLTGSSLYILLTGMSGQSNVNYATVVNLQSTGSALYTDIVGLSGQINNALTATGVSLSATIAATGSTLYTIDIGMSGAFNTQIASTGSQAWNAANNNGINLSGNLAQTGVALLARDLATSGVLDAKITATGSLLYNILTGSSGQYNLNFATITNLALTGSNLYVTMTGLSGSFVTQIALTGQAAWTSANGAANTLSGNMAASGAALIARDLAISGVLQGYITTADADVSSINGQSGVILITGSGGLTVLNGGVGLIVISGDQSISGALTATGVLLGASIASTGQAAWISANGAAATLSGNATQTGVQLGAKIDAVSGWTTTIVSGGLEIRIAATGAASIAYANSIGTSISGNRYISSTGGTITGILTMSGSGIVFINPVIPTYQQGLTFYDPINDSLAYYNSSSGVTVNVGQESILRAFNSGVPKISNGAVVYISGTNFGSGMGVINLAKADTGHNNISIGVATQDIFSGSAGYITYFGLVHGINTSGLPEGRPVYLSQDTFGGLTGVAPIAPNRAIPVGIVTRADPVSGILFVITDIGSMLSGAGDVYINNPLDNQILQYTTTGQRWENRTMIGTGTVSIVTVGSAITFSGSNADALNISGNLALTGSNLQTQINTLTTNLTTTGQTLFLRDIVISGAISTGLALTGSILFQDIVGLSGKLIATGGLLSAVQVTGSVIQNIANFTGLNGTSVFLSGGLICITGGGGSTPANTVHAYVQVTGNFTFATSVERYLWSGSNSSTSQSNWATGTLPTPASASGVDFYVKNLSTGTFFTISGLIDYVQNATLGVRQSYKLGSNGISWIVI